MTTPESNPGAEPEHKLVDVEAAALRYLSRRAHAEGELVRKLRKKDFPQELIDTVCERMREFGYLDDALFATDQSAILMRKGWGPRQISHKLSERGVDDTIVETAIAELGDGADWIEACADRVRSKYRCEPSDLDFEERQKVYRHLKYRGFHDSTIRRVLFDGRG